MNKETLERLLHQYFTNTISPADCVELLNYLNQTEPEKIADIIDQQLLNLDDEGPAFRGLQAEIVLNRIKADSRFTNSPSEQNRNTFNLYRIRWLQIAAVLLVFGALGFYLLRYTGNYHATPNNLSSKQTPVTILPGSKKATLILANGKVILLASAKNGLLTKSGEASISKVKNGQIVYNDLANKNNPAVATAVPDYNTLSVPKGGEYQLTLPDGTKVWLNSASSISYPVAFTGNERRVKLTGEAYFEVAKNKKKPFYVNINQVQVRVLGTHFNINAYSDNNNIQTTLLEGSVQVSENNKQMMLEPGQQAEIGNNSSYFTVSEANIDHVMAWKNGYFNFDDESVRNIMKQVSRWYDLDIEYHGNVDNQEFGGTFYRSKSITELLTYLEQIGKIHFKIIGRRVIVME